MAAQVVPDGQVPEVVVRRVNGEHKHTNAHARDIKSRSDDTSIDDCDGWPPQPDTTSASIMTEILGDLVGLIRDMTGCIDESRHLCLGWINS